jgi:hypothetical protein
MVEARAALERALQLNPHLTAASEHLNWTYCKARDSTGAVRTLEAALARLGAGPSLCQGEGFDELLQFRLFAHLTETGGKVDSALVDSVARAMSRGGGAAVGMAGWCGFLQAQAAIIQRTLALRPPPEAASELLRRLAMTWAGRGAWDSAVVVLNRYVRESPDAWSAWDAYALLVAGSWLGGLEQSEALGRQKEVARLVAAMPVGRDQTSSRAELAWLDGILAWSRGDRTTLEASRRKLESLDLVWAGSKRTPWERSLAAFELALNGERRTAGVALADLEWERAERLDELSDATYLTAIDRLAASRWLLESNDTAQAARLLTWNEAWGGVSGGIGGAVFAGPAYLERARIEEARGNDALAREYYQEFLIRHDMPTPKQRHVVDQARMALARLGR